jgi:hypothetical protein
MTNVFLCINTADPKILPELQDSSRTYSPSYSPYKASSRGAAEVALSAYCGSLGEGDNSYFSLRRYPRSCIPAFSATRETSLIWLLSHLDNTCCIVKILVLPYILPHFMPFTSPSYSDPPHNLSHPRDQDTETGAQPFVPSTVFLVACI